MSKYRKAIVAVVGAAVSILSAAGVEVTAEISQSVNALVTALLVYLVPNE